MGYFMQKLKSVIFFQLFFATIIFLLFACGTTKIPANLTAEERLELAMKLFNKGDYYEAKTQFRIITLSYSGSTIADKAQFYLGESHFNMKEYILAASEYERLIRVYPNSEYVDDAKYKLGLSYFELSPKYSLDQEYTMKAQRQFQEFLEDYYTSDLTPQVSKKLMEIRNKLAKKEFSSAEQYRKMGVYTSAIIYYKLVLDKYYDSKFAARAQYWVGECHRKLKQYEEALTALKLYVEKYPKDDNIAKARERISEIANQLKEQPADADQLSNSDPR
jgi:outer membrane protein assembly factor BamD